MSIEWHPIETAPKDRRILLWFKKPIFTGVNYVFGMWEEDIYAKNPRPYWTHDLERVRGRLNVRANQPTHWAEVAGPQESKE